MEKESFTIVNENEHDITGIIQRDKKGKLPCIIFSPGLLDNRKSGWIKTIAKKFMDDGWAVIRFDYTQGLGESSGHSAAVTITQRVNDLQRVIGYAKRRSYINDKKVVVFGHCYGAMSALAMEGFNHELNAVILVSTPARIESSCLTRKEDREMSRVRLKRYFHVPHEGKELRINYEFYEDGKKIDMDRAARNLTTPALFMHGENDKSIPPADTQRMFDRAIGPKEMIVITKMEHEIKGAAVTKIYAASKEFLKKQKVM